MNHNALFLRDGYFFNFCGPTCSNASLMETYSHHNAVYSIIVKIHTLNDFKGRVNFYGISGKFLVDFEMAF